MNTKKLTLDEIAERAQVSRTTASRVLNNQPHVRPEVRDRVLQVIAETDYHPNPVARSLASQRSGIIGLVLPRSTEDFFTDPYFPRLAQGVAHGCNQYDYILSLFLLKTHADEAKMLNRIAFGGLFDGLIVQAGDADDTFVASLSKLDIPFVVAGRVMDPIEVNYVDIDNEAAAFNIVMHLLHLGYKRIASITGPLNTTAGMDRYHGYLKALQSRDITTNPAMIVEGDFSEMSGFYAMQRILPFRPDAIFVASDTMALGALRAIRQAGLAVPGDIAMVSFDDLPPATMAEPALTTVRQPIRRLGIKAVEVLLEVMENRTPTPQQVILNTELVIRQSCGFH